MTYLHTTVIGLLPVLLWFLTMASNILRSEDPLSGFACSCQTKYQKILTDSVTSDTSWTSKTKLCFKHI